MTAHGTPGRPYHPSPFLVRHFLNPLRTWLGRRSWPGGRPTLTVRGRRSRRPISTPVRVFEFDGARYLVSIAGQSHWVRNLRAVGQGELRLGATPELFRGVEVEGDERDRVVAAYRGLGWRAGMIFRTLPDPADHPVFRVEPIDSAGVAGDGRPKPIQ
jgi:deazaflavin-dependent oxidoreductase (nitroreductase family)